MAKSYEDIPIVELDLNEMANKDLDNWFYAQDIKNRKLFLTSEVMQETVDGIIHHILYYNSIDNGIPICDRQPIILYIASRGGEVDAGMSLADTIALSRTPVYTVNMGYAYSMGFLILLSGHVRYSLPNAKFLLHDGSNFIYNSAAKAMDEALFLGEAEKRIASYIAKHSALTEEEYFKHQRKEWYMFPEEALEHGFIDEILSQDSDIAII